MVNIDDHGIWASVPELDWNNYDNNGHSSNSNSSFDKIFANNGKGAPNSSLHL